MDEAEEIRRFLRQRIRQVYLSGPSFGSLPSYGEDKAGPYSSENPRIVAAFIEAFAARKDWAWLGGRLGDIPSSVYLVPKSGDTAYFGVPSSNPEDTGVSYVKALRLLSADLVGQTRQRVKRCSADVTAINIYWPPRGYAGKVIKDRAEISALLDGLLHLDERVFTFGSNVDTGTRDEDSDVILAWFERRGGRKIYFRLRPPLFTDADRARRLTNPPLPSALWRRIYAE